jgi:hypothetical protein
MDAIVPPEDENVSVFQSNLPIADKLDRARMELLDLSTRNRLLNMPRSAKAGRSLEIVDEKSAEVFRLLIREGKVFSFVAGKARAGEGEAEPEGDEISDLAQPEETMSRMSAACSAGIPTRGCRRG